MRGDASVAERLWQGSRAWSSRNTAALPAAAALGSCCGATSFTPLPADRLIEMVEDETLDTLRSRRRGA